MQDIITCQIESITFEELLHYMRFQANEAFPSLRDENRLLTFATKLHDNAEFCLYRDEGKVVGMIAFYANRRGASFAYIPHIYVEPKYRGLGVFSQMLHKIEDYVKSKGFSEIKLEVNKNNQRAQHAYHNHGFIESNEASASSIYMYKVL